MIWRDIVLWFVHVINSSIAAIMRENVVYDAILIVYWTVYTDILRLNNSRFFLFFFNFCIF